jgi:hypothetical protein
MPVPWVLTAAIIALSPGLDSVRVLISAGVTSGTNATLHVVRRYVGEPATEQLAGKLGQGAGSTTPGTGQVPDGGSNGRGAR